MLARLCLISLTRPSMRWRALAPAATVRLAAVCRSSCGVSSPRPVAHAIEEGAPTSPQSWRRSADATGGAPDVLGHSYGATCTLEATALTGRIRRVVLYESGVGVPSEAGLTDSLAGLLASCATTRHDGRRGTDTPGPEEARSTVPRGRAMNEMIRPACCAGSRRRCC